MMNTMDADGEFAEIDTTEAEFDAMWMQAEREATGTVTNLWIKGGTATVTHQSGRASDVHAISPGTRFSRNRDTAALLG